MVKKCFLVSPLVCLILCICVISVLGHRGGGGGGGRDKFDDDDEEQFPRVLRSKKELSTYMAKKGLTTFVTEDGACVSSSAVVQEVQSYQSIVNRIVDAATKGPFKGKTYDDVALFVDTFGSRLSGTKNLERSIDYVENLLRKGGASNVHSENVGVPKWERGYEKATLLRPVEKNMAVMGLGQSVSTSILGITADAVVLNSYAELMSNPSVVRGKIAVLNYGGPPDNQLDTIDNGYPELARAGARAALYRSAGTYSLYSPHTRRANLYYDGKAPEIPIAYITLEDADFLTRLSARGQKIRIHLNLQSTNANSTSRNVFGDLTGSSGTDEYILFASHTDSWDVGQGAQDDAVGVFLGLEGLELLRSLGLTPRRTIRGAFWTAEEYGYYGSAQYIETNSKTFGQLNTILEADYSCLASTGLVYNGPGELGCILNEIVKLVGSATTGLVVQSPLVRSDVDLFSEINIPVVTLLGDDGRYFWYHHTEADTMTAVNRTELDRCLALWTSTAYILADLKNQLRRF